MPTAAAPAGELAPVSEKLAPDLSLEQLVGAAPDFRAALAVAAKAARNRLPILIIGEPGTGKETFARAIHAASLRARGPLVIVDCKAVPANIIDSELVRPCQRRLPGRLRREDRPDASRPTAARLLLDEIGALPPRPRKRSTACSPPAKSARSAATAAHSVDVRLIATSSTPLAGRVSTRCSASGSRDHVVNLPPLRERSGDIPALARHLLARFAEQEPACARCRSAMTRWRC